ncbi:hypothetical protein JW935_24650 [candidate division KSB1 bacterium]|nr:hypothetical protein [candidate division KSB1 bacterium]
MYNYKIKILLIIFLLYFGYSYVGHRYPKNNFPTFRVNQAGTPDCSGEFSAIQSALQTWNTVSTTYIDFDYGSTTIIAASGYDGTNLILWVESGWDDLYPEYP